MTEKMYDNFQKKYKNITRQLGKNSHDLCTCLEIKS